MKTLLSPYSEYRRYYPSFPESGVYRKQPFCVRSEVHAEGDASVLHNTLSGEVLVLSADEDTLWCSAPENGIRTDSPFWKLLAAHDFIVPEDTDMMYVLEKGREAAVSSADRIASFVSGRFSYVVLTTTDCNARCFYCYEKGRPRIRMDDGIALRTAEFIEENYRKNGRQVKIQWFGGEPLYNMDAIRIICGYLRNHDVPFSSSMISNGYLLTGEVQKEAVKEWHLHHVQITLDGTEETYNRCKSFIYQESEGSPFLRVVNNIFSSVQNGIRVNIRMNVDSHNYVNLLELADMLAERTAADPMLREMITVYCHPLFEDYAHPDYPDRLRKVAEYDIALTRRINELGLGSTQSPKEDFISRGPSLHYCMVDSPFSLTVLPDGHLGKCEHFSDDHFVGDINGEIDSDAIRQMAEFKAYHNECRSCPFPPLCHKLSVCSNIEKNGCVTESIIRGAKTDLALKALYEKHLNDAKATPDVIKYNPKVSDKILHYISPDVVSKSHCEYSVLGRNGNALSISFVSVLQMGSHSIQAIPFRQVGDMRKFPESDTGLLESIAGVAEGYLREHTADLLLMCSPADSRSRAVHRFVGMCFDRFGYGNGFRRLRIDGRGSDGGDYLLTVFLSMECKSFDDVVAAVSQQSTKIIDYYKEISEKRKRKDFRS